MIWCCLTLANSEVDFLILVWIYIAFKKRQDSSSFDTSKESILKFQWQKVEEVEAIGRDRVHNNVKIQKNALKDAIL